MLIGSPETLSGDATQCVTVAVGSGRDYYFGFRFKSSVPGTSGSAVCSVAFIPSGHSCDFSETTDGGQVMAEFNNDNWIASGTIRLTAPAGTAMIRLRCTAVAAIGYYDQLYISTTTPGIPAF